MKTKTPASKRNLIMLFVGMLITLTVYAETTLSGDYNITGKLRTTSGTNLGLYAISIGPANVANNTVSVALGSSDLIYGSYATGLGTSILIGNSTNSALGYGSNGLGYISTITGNYSNLLASYSTVSGNNATGIGQNVTVSGNYAMSMGNSTTASSYACLVVGQFNNSQSGQSSTTWTGTNDLFVVGNGTAGNATANAFVISKNGNITIPKRQGDIIMGSFGNGGGD